MKLEHIKYKLILMLFALFANGFAGNETQNARLEGSDLLIANSSLNVSDQKFTGAANWINGFINYSNQSKVEFGLDENKHVFHATFFRSVITFNQYVTDANLSTQSFNALQLEITYDPVKGTSYKDKSTLMRTNVYRSFLSNIQIVTYDASNNIIANPSDLYLENEVSTERYYTFTPQTAFLNLTDLHTQYLSSENSVEVYWDHYIAAEEYELEWAFLDDYTDVLANPRNASLISYDFEHDATRIITNGNSYKIPLIYEKGYLIFRIRPIGKNPLNPTERIEGTWSNVNATGTLDQFLSAAPSMYFYISTAMVHTDDEINWKAVQTFAEKGKSGVGSSYMDALMNNRQSIARLNTESKTIAQSTMYDFFGRPTVSVLPVPVNQTTISFKPSLNLYKSGSLFFPYDKKVFSGCISCGTTAKPMSPENNIGTSNYYSSFNTNKSGLQGYLPDAEGYPFSQVQYMNDMSGRVIKQTLPGSAFNLNSPHAVQYAYTQPSQVELDRLFGSEAGRAKHYKKIVTTDPNGQRSVQYLDLYDRTVATALLDANPTQLMALSSNVGAIELTDDLMEYNVAFDDDLCYEANLSFFVSNTGEQQQIHYQITPASFTPSACAGLYEPATCFSCSYDMEMTIFDDCGNELLFFDDDENPSTPNTHLSAQLGAVDPYQSNCVYETDATARIVAPAYSFTVVFPKSGVYTLKKKICVSEAPIQAYENFFNESNCHQQLESFITEQLSQIDLAGCFSNCADCEAQMQSYMTQTNTSLTAAQQAEIVAKCNQLCGVTNETSVCEQYRNQMAAMFTPGQPYATYTLSSDGITFTSTDPYSIFNTTATNQLGVQWNNVNYVDAQSNPIYVTNLAGNLVLVKDLPINEFISTWEPVWGMSLIDKHPEYCKYKMYCTENTIETYYSYNPSAAANLAELDAYETAMQNVDEYDVACPSGYLDPVNLTPSVDLFPSACDVPSSPTTIFPDPIFDFLNAADKIELTKFVTDYDPSNTLYEFVGNNVDGDHLFGASTCSKDNEWKMFRDMYLSKREQILNEIKNTLYSNLTQGSGCNRNIENLTFNGQPWPQIFSDPTAAFVDQFGFTPNGTTPPTTGQVTAATEEYFVEQCSTNCSGYAVNWLDNLNVNCPTFYALPETLKTTIINDLIEVCRRGCDATNPLGSSNYPPQSIINTPSSPNYYAAGSLLPSPYIIGNSVGTPTTVYSFQAVLNFYLGNNVCNENLLNYVSTYNTTAVVAVPAAGATDDPTPETLNVSGPMLDKCGCETILQVNYDFNHLINVPPDINSPKELFEYRFGYQLGNFNMLSCACANATAASVPTTSEMGSTTVGAPLWTPNGTFNWDLNAQYFVTHSSNIPVPAALACAQCINCEMLTTKLISIAKKDDNTFPDNPTQTELISFVNQNPALLQNAFNGAFNYGQILSFLQDCQQFYGLLVTDPKDAEYFTISNNVTPQAGQLQMFLNQKAGQGKLVLNHTLNLVNASQFINTNLYAFQPNVNGSGTLQYAFTNISANQIKLTITRPAINNMQAFNCEIMLKRVGGSVISFASVTSITDLQGFYSDDFLPYVAENAFTIKVSNGAITETWTGASNLYKIGDYEAIPCLGANCFAAPYDPSKQSPLLCTNAGVSDQPPISECLQSQINQAINNAQTLYEDYLAEQLANFVSDYKQHCFANLQETFNRTYNLNEYHYTLYYYEQAGNLTRTVPPEGVTPLPITSVIPVGSPVQYPAHATNFTLNRKMVSQYQYNSYNSPVYNTSPDQGEMKYFYDLFGRIVASQNAKQAAQARFTYSYTLYDELGRIIETGEMMHAPFPSKVLSEAIAEDPTLFMLYVNNSTRSQVNHVIYDAPLNSTIPAQFSNGQQEDLRNRVASTMYEDVYDGNLQTYNNASHYSYDEHGNVKELVQENVQLDHLNGQRYKNILYDYELISGNVNKIVYQKNKDDQFIHTYTYDADNRLHETFTSKDGINYDRDAKYFYYEHGPLARIETGDQKVQGTDYFYTIQGWIKGVNSNQLNSIGDPGKDGMAANTFNTNFTAGLNKYIAKDAMGYSLNYFDDATNKDYTSINSASFNNPLTQQQPPIASATLLNSGAVFNLANEGPSLYNGNISSMVTSFIDIDPSNTAPDYLASAQLSAYRYDQLHRIKQSKTFRDVQYNSTLDMFQWQTATTGNYDDSYLMQLNYDANGNITHLKRNGPSTAIKPGSNLLMDDLTYTYYGSQLRRTNKLACVSDVVPAGNYPDDIDGYGDCSTPLDVMTDPNFDYDQLGNMIKDKEQCIDNIEWTLDRKIKRITRSETELSIQSKTYSDLEFEYNSQRQRVLKIEKPRDAATKALKPQQTWVYTYYTYDASGNVMGVYKRSYVDNHTSYLIDKYELSEFYLYGSSLLGSLKYDGDPMATRKFNYTLDNKGNFATVNYLAPDPIIPANNSVIYASRILGKKLFDGSNHLGNVLVKYSDRKLQDNYGVNEGSLTEVEFYTPDIYSHTDYYPFGSSQAGRSFQPANDGRINRGFNGMEEDEEMGNQNFGMRIYNSDLGLFLSVDPYGSMAIGRSGYSFAGNSPIAFIDVNGGYQISPDLAKRYPKLDRMLRIISNIVNDPCALENPIIRAFIDEAGLSGTPEEQLNQARSILSYGSGPELKVVKNLKDEKGTIAGAITYFPDSDEGCGYEAKATIAIEETYVSDYCNDSRTTPNSDGTFPNKPTQKYDSDIQNAGNELMVFIQLMHEAVHFGDRAFGPSNSKNPPGPLGDIGDLWERCVFNTNIGSRNQLDGGSLPRLPADRIIITNRELSRMPNRAAGISPFGAMTPGNIRTYFNKAYTIGTGGRKGLNHLRPGSFVKDLVKGAKNFFGGKNNNSGSHTNVRYLED